MNGLSEVADLADELMSFSVIFIKGVCFGALGLWGFWRVITEIEENQYTDVIVNRLVEFHDTEAST